MLRNWGGIVDVTPDRSPIIGKTPVPGLFVNCGWGTGGFKAIPAGGVCLAHHLAAGEQHPLAAFARKGSPLHRGVGNLVGVELLGAHGNHLYWNERSTS